jgi:hypothetical protein
MNRSFDYDEREDYPTDSDLSYRKNSSYELDRRSHPDRYDKRSPSPRNGKTGRTGNTFFKPSILFIEATTQ